MNLRIILIHLFATILIIAGAKQFAVLKDIRLVETISNYEYGTKEFNVHLTKTGNINSGERMAYYLRWTFYSALLGLFVSFIISFIICFRKKALWLNSFIVLIVGLFIQKLLFNLSIVRQITNSFGELFISFGLQYTVIINGLLWTTVGLLIFFNKWTNKFIIDSQETTATNS